MLEYIYVTRHGFRSNWVTDPETGTTSASILSPTNIPSDPPLAAHGVAQAHQLAEYLATVAPTPTRVYTSPFYRCLQTVEPVAAKIGITEVRAENGIGEWYGRARFEHPSPASLEVLHTFFPRLSTSYVPVCIPSTSGESVQEIHHRVAFALAHIIEAIDKEHLTGSATAPKAILLCAHAAPNIAIGRVLVGDSIKDIKTGTCSLSVYKRKIAASVPGGKATVPPLNLDGSIPVIEWSEGKGVGGGWEIKVNGDCAFLEKGEERNWWFSGEEDWDFPLKTIEVGKAALQEQPAGIQARVETLTQGREVDRGVQGDLVEAQTETLPGAKI